MSESKTKRISLVVISVVIIIGALFMILWRSTESSPGQLPIVEPVSRETDVLDHASRASSISSPQQSTPLPEESPAPVENNKKVVAAPPEEITEAPLVDPEDQPRTFFHMDFTNLSSLPEGFTLEDVELTDKGIMLSPLAEGEEATPRYGLITAPPEEMHFLSNAVSPLWKQDVSDGTSVFIEVSMSPDGDTWGIWHPIAYDEDAGEPAEYYPDGSPNPNFGYTPGGVLCWGMSQFKYFRYRATLYSETKDSPLFSGFRLFYQDSTLGQGDIAEVGDDVAK